MQRQYFIIDQINNKYNLPHFPEQMWMTLIRRHIQTRSR